jgi:hypothetical protein
MTDFHTSLVKDATIGDITPDLEFSVVSGAAQTTYQSFQATSSSNSALIWNIQVPSESIVIGRDALISAQVTTTLTIGSATLGSPNAVPVGVLAMNYGATDAYAPFPLNSLFSTLTAQINNTTVSTNLIDTLPQVLRMNDSQYLSKYNSTTPAMPDMAYQSYADGLLANNNPLASFNTASNSGVVPRGAWVLDSMVVVHQNFGGVVDALLTSGNIQDTWTVTLTSTFTEPLFLSPFTWGNPEHNAQGFLGINNMAITANIDSNCSRQFRTANPYISNIQLGSAGGNGFANTQMLFKFLSTQPSDLVESRNVVPYMDMPRYLSNFNGSVNIAPLASTTIVSQNIQISQIPDLFVVCVRKPMSTQTYQDSDSFLRINNISCNLNNSSGLLSSASAADLWRFSKANGSNQTWNEFGGFANVADNVLGEGTVIPTTGSLLILSPALQMSLPDYISSSSTGQYNFTFNVNVTNQSAVAVTPEICVICVNSGMMVTNQGVSSTYSGMLTKEMVLSAKSKDHYSTAEEIRRVGGMFLNRCARPFRRAVGSGMSGGASSGGAHSGGASKYC